MAAMSVLVFSNGRTLAGALALSGPLTRFSPERIEAMKTPLIIAGLELSKTLGGERE
jgi:DNA-binding IclR family transcriptional regulator